MLLVIVIVAAILFIIFLTSYYLKKKQKQKEVHVMGMEGCGLGNILFQVATAIYYAEKHNYKIVLNSDQQSILWGSSRLHGKHKCRQINGRDISYLETIFDNHRLLRRPLSTYNHEEHNTMTIANSYGDDLYQPEDHNIYIKIIGLCQNYKYFKPVLDKLPGYLNLSDPLIIKHLADKYQLERHVKNQNILLCFRRGADFLHMNKITTRSYCNALDLIFRHRPNMNRVTLVILSDVDVSDEISHITQHVMTRHKVAIMNIYIIKEDDISQIYAGLCCDFIVLCESTFHYWIAVLHRDSFVIVFKDTHNTLKLDTWHTVSYS